MNWRSISLFLFGIALFYAPLAYGCTTRPTASGLDALLLAATTAALLHKLVAREPFRIPRLALLCVLVLAAIGSVHILNARFEVDPTTADFVPRETRIPFLPAALDRNSAFATGFDLLVLGGAFLVLIDLAQHRRERWQLLSTLAISGLVFALLGVCLKLANYRTLPFSTIGEAFTFATYLYHGNAAAFLNLCWPASLALVAHAMRERSHLGLTIWVNGFVFTFGALFVNASKFGHALALPALILAAWLVWRCVGKGWNTSPAVVAISATVLLASLAIMIVPMLAVSIERWDVLATRGETSRMITSQASLGMIRDAPLWGIGPGCFRWGFPFYTAQLGDRIRGVWIHAHQDYIQTFAEWGIIGGLVWMGLIGGGLWQGWRRVFRGAKELSTVASVMALSLTAVHCLLDFPLQIASLRYVAAVHLAILWGNREKHRRTPNRAD